MKNIGERIELILDDDLISDDTKREIYDAVSNGADLETLEKCCEKAEQERKANVRDVLNNPDFMAHLEQLKKLERKRADVEQFRALNARLKELYGEPLTARQGYSMIFGGLGRRGLATAEELEAIAREPDAEKRRLIRTSGNGVIVWKSAKGTYNNDKFTEDLDAIEDVISRADAEQPETGCTALYISPVSYFGRSTKKQFAADFYGIGIDVDGVGVKQIDALINLCNVGYAPRPNIIAASGHGAHLYYIFPQPIKVTQRSSAAVELLKRLIIGATWNRLTSTYKEIQWVDNPAQGFRAFGSASKLGKDCRVTPYLVSNVMLYPEEIVNSFTADSNEKRAVIDAWEKVGKPTPKSGFAYTGKKWAVSRAVYDDYLKKCREGAAVGSRYYRIMCLAAIATKCATYDEKKNPNPVTYEELKRDALELVPVFNAVDSSNPFTVEDAKTALKAWNNPHMYRLRREKIEHFSHVSFGAPIRRRPAGKRLKQSEHLADARAVRDSRMQRRGKNWTDGNGRPAGSGTDAPQIVKEWRLNHTDGRKADCSRETGLHRNTVAKWWDV